MSTHPRSIYNKSGNEVSSVSGPFSGDVVGTQSNMQIASGVIVNNDISPSANISDTKLATISTALKVSNSATTATSANTNNSIIARDGAGEFIATTMFGDIDSAVGGTLTMGGSNASNINIGTANSTQVVNVGTGSGITTINLGGTGDTVNVSGTLTYINTTDLNITDKNITINKGGSTATGASAGITIEEGGTGTGYVKVDGTRASWQLKAPGSTGIVSIVPSSSNYTIDRGSHDPVTVSVPANGLYVDPTTQIATLSTASSINTGSLTSIDWNTFNNAASAVLGGLNGHVTGALTSNTIASGVITNSHINASAAIADTKLGTISTSGKVANSATTASSSNNSNSIVLRDNNGDFTTHRINTIIYGTMYGNSEPSAVGAILYLGQNDASFVSIAGGNQTNGITIGGNGTNLINIGLGSTAKTITVGSSGDTFTLNAAASIPDSKLATISTSGKVSNSATTGTSSNSNNTLVLRDGSGNFASNSITTNSSLITDNINAATGSTISFNNISATNLTATATSNNIAARTLITSNGTVTTNGNASPTVANQALVSTSSTAAKWDYPLPWVYFAPFGGPWTGSTYNRIGPAWPTIPATGKYMVDVYLLGYTNTNMSAVNTFYILQGGTQYKTYTWLATAQQLFHIRVLANCTSTLGFELFAETNLGSLTILDHELFLTKVNGNP